VLHLFGLVVWVCGLVDACWPAIGGSHVQTLLLPSAKEISIVSFAKPIFIGSANEQQTSLDGVH